MPCAATLVTSDGRLLAAAVIGALAGVYWFYKGFRLLQRKRLMLDTPASKIRSASMGLVEISGLAIGPYVCTSPLRQLDCYYYRSVAWELKQRGKNSEWVKVAEETLHVPFYVDDNTDRVLVDPRGADMDLHCDLEEQYNRSAIFGSSEMPGSVAEFLMRHGANPDKHIKVEEYCIKPKNFLFILGTLSQNPGLDASVMPAWAGRPGQRSTPPVQEPGEDSDVPAIIRLSQTDISMPAAQMTQQQKIAAALMKAGVSNPTAWAAAGIGVKTAPATAPKLDAVTVQPAAAEDTAPETSEGFDLHPPVVLMKGTHEPVFFISWRSQRDLVKSLGWRSALMIWGGPALTLGCIYFLLWHFGRL
jgi:E3 Ubiquitin ligase